MPKMMLGIAASISIAGAHDPRDRGVDELDQQHRDDQRQRHGDHHGDQRREDRAGQAASTPYLPPIGDHATVVSTSVPRVLIAGHES